MKTTSHSSSRSFKRKRLKTEKSSEDRISSLPDEIIHHIFSFMDMRDVVRTSILSNRWKTLWLSTSNLNFSFSLCSVCKEWDVVMLFDSQCDSCKKTRKSSMDFVDRVLMFRESCNIDKFNLFCTLEKLDGARLHTWVLAALKRNAQSLILQLYGCFIPIELPSKLFTSNSTVLKLLLNNSSGAPPAKLPNSICTSSRIKDLELKGVSFPNANADGELILSCPVLENLCITECQLNNIKIFKISTPLLESLECAYLYTRHYHSCQVNTCTPNLKRIMVKARSFGVNSMLDYCLENLTSLASAEVSFDSIDAPKKVWSKWLMKVLSGVHNVESLKLTDRSFQLLADFPESFKKLSDIFSNLKFVVLDKPGSLYAQAVLKHLFGNDIQWRLERGGVFTVGEKKMDGKTTFPENI
ncbi:F-box/LRR-repeat protein [Thalictrum thalictroides]|uniref:F-box/LRR-repeat protein n=1 Tax=Thalictrum thalictroides TaxID=46969 RepID=A0A7J6X226_THATH|nr:F-box/LRR-repeat protein [Thalictrum thalictroides]